MTESDRTDFVRRLEEDRRDSSNDWGTKRRCHSAALSSKNVIFSQVENECLNEQVPFMIVTLCPQQTLPSDRKTYCS